MKSKLLRGCIAAGFSAVLLAGASAHAATFSQNFNNLQLDPNDPDKFVLPDGTFWSGSVASGITAGYDLRTGGVGGSGTLKLTTATAGQSSSFVILNPDADANPAGFDLTFQALVGGGNGADGMSFYVGDFPDTAGTGEEGPALQGLTVSWDTFNNGGTVAEAPAIDLKWNNVVIAHRTGTQINAQSTTIPVNLQSGAAYWPVKLHADPDGTVDLVINNVVIYTNVPVWRKITSGPVKVGFGARTGNSNENHFIDDINYTTVLTDAAEGQPFLVDLAPVRPIDQNASSVGGVTVTIRDSTYSVNTNTVRFLYNNAAVTAPVSVIRTKSDPLLEVEDTTVISYAGVNGVLPAGAGTATISYFTTSTPAVSNLFSFSFNIIAATALNPAWRLTTLDENNAGFKGRLYQMSRQRSPGDQNITPVGERQVAYGFIDPLTHLPYPDISLIDPSTLDTNGYFNIDGVLNYNQTADPAAGLINANNSSRPDSQFPGIPGSDITLGSGMDNFAGEFIGYIKLAPGGYRFGLHADDRFRFSFGNSHDAVGTTALAASTGANVETSFDVLVSEAGYYPFRCSYWEGGGDGRFELFWYEPGTGRRILVNDPELTQAPRAFREAAGTRPWVKRVLPVENWVGAFPNEKVLADIVDGPNITVDDASIKMQINNVDQTITKSKLGAITTVTRPASDTNLLPSGLNTVRIIYNYTEGGNVVTKTNQYAFTVAPYYNPIPLSVKVDPAQLSGETGFSGRYTQMDRLGNGPNDQGGQGRINGGGDANRMPNPEIQLWGGEINVTNGLPFANIANPGAGTIPFTTEFPFFNFNITWAAPATYANGNIGFFQSASPPAPLPGGNKVEISMPGLPSPTYNQANGVAAGNINPSNGGLDNYVLEVLAYLELKKGITVLGFNSDDGFVCTTAPNPKDTLGTLLGWFSGGRGNGGAINAANFVPAGGNPPPVTPGVLHGSSLFSVIVPEDGIYPIRLLYWQGGGGVNAEFFSVDQESGTYVLVGDDTAVLPPTELGGDPVPAPNIIKVHKSLNASVPEKPWTRFSVSPTPWDNRQQQSGPGPLKMIGRTRNSIQSADIYNGADVNPTAATGNSAPWADVPIGGIIANGAPGGVADPTIRLLLDGAEVAATKVVDGTDLKVTYQPVPPLASGSTHTAALVYSGTTNKWTFKVQSYQTIPASAKATVAADTSKRGFTVKMAQSVAARTGGNTAAAAEAQLQGNPANVAIQNPATADGRYIYPGIINFNNNNNNVPSGGTPVGNFQPPGTYGTGWPFPYFVEDPIPGLPGTGTGTGAARWENFTAEIFAWLEFPSAGYYRFGGNGDDGFLVKVGTQGVTNGVVLFTQDRGAGAADFPFSFVVTEPGLYPVRLVWWQGTGGGQIELFTYDQSGGKIPVNDPNNPNAIKAYYELGSGQPQITGFSVSGSDLTITWTGGGELVTSDSVSGPYTGTGDTDGSFTVTINTTTPAKFYQVRK